MSSTEIKAILVRAAMILVGLLVYAGLCLSATRTGETPKPPDNRCRAAYESESLMSSADEPTGAAVQSVSGEAVFTELGDANDRHAGEVEAAAKDNETADDLDVDARAGRALNIEQDCQRLESEASDDCEDPN